MACNLKVLISYYVFDVVGIIIVILSILSFYLFIYIFMFIQEEEDEALDLFFSHLNREEFFWLFYFTFFLVLYKIDLILGITYQLIFGNRQP